MEIVSGVHLQKNMSAMGEISKVHKDEGNGRVRRSGFSTRIDMTPMVDLAFLLLTFFILTTTFFKPHLMEVAMPDPKGEPSQIISSRVVNVVLGEKNEVYWWTGDAVSAERTNYSSGGVRRVLTERMQVNPASMVLIKPMATCKFSNVVDILDEMAIVGVSRYAIVDVTREDQEMVGTVTKDEGRN